MAYSDLGSPIGQILDESQKPANIRPSKGPQITAIPNQAPLSPVILEKLGTAEEQAARQKLARDLMVQQQAQARALAAAQARSGVRGGAAAAQQARLAQQIAQQRAVGEEEGALQRRMFNLQQAQKEQFANVASELALRQIASSLEGQKAMAEAARQGAEAQLDIARRSGGGLCCFIFLEANNGVLDRIARRARDELMTDKNRRGYYKLSEVLVPLMRKHSTVKFMVNWGMVKPMLSFGKWKYGENKIGRIFAPIANFWLNTFDYLGGDHPFLRDNGEMV